jgi:D-alanyl-D-alanine carboxypeptidase/D-alanyl-D-alanine-endopeptidase (penicillin-binding protein 4)
MGLDRRSLVVLVLIPVLVAVGLSGTAAWSVANRAGQDPVTAGSTGTVAVALSVPTGQGLPGLAADAAQPTTEGLRQALAPVLGSAALGPSVAFEVVDAGSGDSLYGVAAQTPLVPASTTKLLTGAAALTTIGPGTTLATRAVTGTSDSEIVLVGGGDVLLAAGDGDPGAVVGRAGLADLATRTAATLTERGRETVTLRLDDSLFSGPAVNPAWNSADVSDGFVAPVMALEVNEGKIGSGTSRRADPALAAATEFASRLRERGITVTGSITRGQAADSAQTLGEVRSASLGELVELALTDSDNTVSEALARLVAAHSGDPVTFIGAGQAVVAQIDELGVPVTGVRLLGGSGLSRGNRIPVRTLTGLLALATDADRPELGRLLSGLPVAGASGTLTTRFDRGSQVAARGLVRAKTGSLKGVNTLAGLVVDADGRLLVFAILADDTGPSASARRALDSVATVLAECGCR